MNIELNFVQQRIFNNGIDRAFVFTLNDEAKNYILKEGTDTKYGARHLKRAIERLLVQPMSNLISSNQIHGGDWIGVEFEEGSKVLHFAREAEGLPVQDMLRLVDTSVNFPVLSPGAPAEGPRTSTKKR